MKNETQPTKVSYFYGQGWKEFKLFLKKFWEFNQEDIRRKTEKVENGKGIMHLSGTAQLLSCFSLIFFGTLFFVMISVIVSVVLGIAFLLVYVLIFIVFWMDRIHLIRKGIFVACPNCKNKYLIPIYLCPVCGSKHTDLTPGKYGIFSRTCQCGHKIPSHFITNRGKLEARCHHCGFALSGTGNKPICIPVIGGRSSGKTAYISAFCYDFIEKVAPRNELMIKHYNEDTKKVYEQEITNDYLGGTTRMTKEELDINQASSKAFSFLIQNHVLKPDRLIQIYDVAGESFVKNDENEEQLQYSYCHGIIFMLDPLSIPVVRNYLDDSINEIDRSSVGTLDVDVVLDSFMNKLRVITGQTSTAVFDVPIAIVISKGDLKTLDRFIGEDIISEYMTKKQYNMEMYSVAEDKICRQFLIENGLAHFVNTIELKFKNNRFFKCSAIGHTRERGRYNPRGVLEPMEWIFQTTDLGLKRVLRENKFEDVEREE